MVNLESNSPDILALCGTNLDDSIDSGSFSERGYLPLIRKDSSTHMHGLAVYVKEGLHFARDLSLENSAVSYLCFDWLYFFQCLILTLLSQMTLLKWLTFLLGSQTVIVIALLFWIYFLLTILFVPRLLSLHWEILIMLLSQFPLTFLQIHYGMPQFIT